MKKSIVCLALFALMAATAWAAPAYPNWEAFTQPDGTQILLQLQGDEYYHYLADQNGQVMVKGEDGFYRPQGPMEYQTFLSRRKAAKNRRAEQQGPNKDYIYNPAPRGVVIIVEFPDQRCQSASTPESMSQMFNGENYTFGGAYGSAKKYFEEQSGNLYSPQFDVYGPILLPHNEVYYGQNDENGDDMRVAQAVIDACTIADTMYNVDFSLYDSDHDGFVDFIYLLYAGHGENFTGADPNLIWPHKWNIMGYTGWDNPVTLDGVSLATYACSAELQGLYGTNRSGIGTLCHEFSHVLGLPDYYDTKYGENNDNHLLPATWDIMAGGNHNLDGKSPANYTIHEKFQFGWATPTLLTHTQDVSMAASQDYYYISLDGAEKQPDANDTVYYLENRQKKSWDRGLDGHGLMIWRVVYDDDKWSENIVNNTAGKPNYIYIAADGTYTGGDSGDPFPGTSRVNHFEVPNSIYSLTNIAESGSMLNFRFVMGCDGYTVEMNAPHVNVVESQASRCYPANEPYTATLTAKKNYEITGVNVTMGGYILTAGVDYTFIGDVLTIPALTGDAVINVLSEKLAFQHDSCMLFSWIPETSVVGNAVVLNDLNWTVDVTGSAYRGYDGAAQDRGAQFGSRSTSPGNVSLHTDEMANCLITGVEVAACVAGEGGLLEVILDDETIGTVNLTTDIVEYPFTNPEEWHGALDIRFRNLQKALFIRKIIVHFDGEKEELDGLENLPATTPQGEIIGIYSMTGQSMKEQIEDLPRGLYLVVHTDGTEKIMVK